MNIINVLLDSLRLLRERPQLFAPKLSSAFLSSVWLLFMENLVGSVGLRTASVFYLVSMPLIILLGVFVPLMTAEMVRRKDEEGILLKGFTATLKQWPQVLATCFLMFVVIVVTSVPAVLGFSLFYLTGSMVYLAGGIGLTVLLTLVESFLIYFLPISVVTERSFFTGLKNAVKSSFDSKKEVSALTLFSFAMFGIVLTAQGPLEGLGASFFVLGRLLSAAVTTYMFVVSPNFYLKKFSEEKE